MTPISRSPWRHTSLPAAWVVGALFIAWSASRGPFDPAARAYGANWPGDVRRAVVELTFEVAALYAILRPTSYAASWKRALAAFLLFLPWTILGGLGTMHGGRIASYHFLWQLLVSVALFGTTILSASIAVRPPGALSSRRDR